MLRKFEARLFGQLLESRIELGFKATRNHHVAHFSARRTQHVVVVPEDVFGQLVSTQIVGADHTLNGADTFEHQQISIQRTLRDFVALTLEIFRTPQYFLDRKWFIGRFKERDDGPSLV